MREGWKIIPFEKSIQKVKYTTKVPSSDYLPVGAFPIVSQEEGLISGYWDNDADVFHHSKPVVIFGDHTRIIKYVDFDFVLGADGVKILLPVDGLSAKFFSYYLRWYKVPCLGYSRHFKLLKELSVPVPPVAEQEKIVDELDCLSGIIEKKKEQLKELDNLAQSIFYDMFGDPVANERGWDVCNINDVCSMIVRGPFGSALKKEFFVEHDETTYKVYEQKHAIQKDATIGSYYIDKERFQSLKRFEVRSGDIIMSCSGTIGEFFEIPLGAEKGVINQALLKYTLNKSICKAYFLFAMEFIKESFDTKGSGLQNIGSVGTIKKTRVSLPPLAIQQSFAEKIEAIEKQKESVKQAIKETETLFNSRMGYYFN